MTKVTTSWLWYYSKKACEHIYNCFDCSGSSTGGNCVIYLNAETLCRQVSWHRWGNLESLTSQRDTKLLNVSIVKVSSEPTMWSGDASFNKWQNFCLLSFHFIWCNNCNKARSLPWSSLHVHTDSHSAPYQSVWIHSELSEEVHSILWRFNHISRLCLGATNLQHLQPLFFPSY